MTARSKGKLAAVWVCSPARSWWAVLHVVRRHGGRVESTVVLELDIPRAWLRRNRKGLNFIPRDVPASRLRRVLTFQDMAASPVEGTAG